MTEAVGGVPQSIEKVESPYSTQVEGDKSLKDDTKLSSDEEKTQEKKSIVLPVVIIFGVFLGLVIGGFFLTKAIVQTDPSTDIALETPQTSSADSIEPTVSSKAQSIPELPDVSKNSNLDTAYLITGVDSPAQTSAAIPNGDIEKILGVLADLADQLTVLKKSVDVNSQTIQDISRSSKQAAENSQGILASTEIIAAKITTQMNQVQDVKKMVVADVEQKKKRLESPPFRVSSRSVWGNTVYLTIATDDNFEQQAVLGSVVSGWTLKDIDLKNKKSMWANTSGEHYEMLLP